MSNQKTNRITRVNARNILTTENNYQSSDESDVSDDSDDEYVPRDNESSSDNESEDSKGKKRSPSYIERAANAKKARVGDLTISNNIIKEFKQHCGVKEACVRNKTVNACFSCSKEMCGKCTYETISQSYCSNCKN